MQRPVTRLQTKLKASRHTSETDPETDPENDTETVINLQQPFQIEDKMAVKLSVELALKVIPEFSGIKSDFHKFLNCCDAMYSDGKLSENDNQLFLTIVKSKLSGNAYSLTKYKEIKEWDDLKKILQEFYLDKRTVAQLQSELVNCRQHYNEDVRNFSNRIERLLIDLTDACIASEGKEASKFIESLNNKTALRAFIDGLNDNLKLFIKACRFTTLAEAVQAATEEERSNPSRNRFKNSNQKDHFSKSLKCSNCSKMGHSSQNCFLKNSSSHSSNPVPTSSLPQFSRQPIIKTEPTSPQSSYYARTFKINVTCAYCKRPGHHIRDCRKRMYNENKKKEQTHNTNPSVRYITNNSENARGSAPETSGLISIQNLTTSAV